MAKINYYTPEGYKKLKDELNYLKTKGRTEIANMIAEARDKGDLSENAEYDAAKDAQGLHELKISKLEEAMSSARILNDADIDTSKVTILSTVKIRNTKNKMEVAYTLVAQEEADIKQNKISVGSPIAAGLLGKKVGDVVTIQTPRAPMEFEILDISR